MKRWIPSKDATEAKDIDCTYDVPTSGAITKDGKTVLIDRDIPRWLKVNFDWVDVHYFIAKHERAEYTRLSKHQRYDPSHEYATTVENAELKKFGVDETAYNEVLRPYIERAWRKVLKRVHPDIDMEQMEDYPKKVREVEKLLKKPTDA